MSGDFKQVTILGGGLLGGSLALALPASKNPPAVRLWSRRAETAAEATSIGIGDVFTDLAEAIAGSDLVVLAVPRWCNPPWMQA